MKILLPLALLLCSVPCFAAPACMYQNTLSGPATGGEGGGGLYLKVFGTGFGSSVGSISGTVNGTAITSFINLGADGTNDRQVVRFQVPSGTTGSGVISLTFPTGTCNNLPFTVRSAAIYYIGSGIDNATTGVSPTCANLKNGTALDGNAGSGTFASPWKMTNTPSTQINGGGSNVAPPTNALIPGSFYACINPGDVIVFLSGANYIYADQGGLFTSLAMHDGYTATSSAPTVLQSRNGPSTVTIGSDANVSTGIRDYTDVGNVIDELTAIGNGTSVSFSEPTTGPFMRVVGSNLQAPHGDGAGACIAGGLDTDTNSGIYVLGNYVNNCSTSLPAGASAKEWHAMYFGGNQMEIGWNRIANTVAFNGIQINNPPDNGIGFGNLLIHDDDVTQVNGAAFNLASLDPGQGVINIYNNICHHVGLAPASDSDGTHACFSFPGEAPSASAGTVNFYNNTMYDCSAYANTSGTSFTACIAAAYETAQTGLTILTTNNIIYQPAYTFTSSINPYFSFASTHPAFTGSNNLFFSGGTPASTTGASALTSQAVPTDPKFFSATNGAWTNYQLLSGSPAIGAGSASLFPTLDFAGVTRPSPPAIGALEPGIAPPTFIGVTFSIGTAFSIGTGID